MQDFSSLDGDERGRRESNCVEFTIFFPLNSNFFDRNQQRKIQEAQHQWAREQYKGKSPGLIGSRVQNQKKKLYKITPHSGTRPANSARRALLPVLGETPPLQRGKPTQGDRNHSQPTTGCQTREIETEGDSAHRHRGRDSAPCLQRT